MIFWWEYLLGGGLIGLSVILTILVLMQSGKDKKLSGTIAGGSSDTYYGKGKGHSREKILARLTVVAAVAFAILIVVTFVVFSRCEKWIAEAVAEAAKEAASAGK